MPDRFVNVPYAKQKETYYCGPGTLQMVLSALGVASPATPPTWQDQLWTLIEQNTGASRPAGATSLPSFPSQKCEWCSGIGWKCWNTTPGVLQFLLNGQQAVATYTPEQFDNEEDATDAVLDSIDANLPGVALVRGWQHWLVVSGYMHDEPGATAVGGRNVNGVYLRDPWVESTHYVTWSAWKSDYVKFVPCGQYAETIVMMRAVRRAQPPPAPPTNLRLRDRQKLFLAERRMVKLMTAAAITDAAASHVKGLLNSRLRVAFSGATPESAALVQRLDAPDRYYYVVSFKSEERITGRLLLDASDGSVREASGIDKPDAQLAPYMTPRIAIDRVLENGTRWADALRYAMRPESIGQHPVLVWKPCEESSSPFLPFYQFSLGDSFVYYRVDGEPFQQLTTGAA